MILLQIQVGRGGHSPAQTTQQQTTSETVPAPENHDAPMDQDQGSSR